MKILLKTLHSKLKGMIYYFLSNSENPIVRSRAHNISLELEILPEDQLDGYTDGKIIHVGSAMRFMPGIVFHELGHLLYTWFKGSQLLVDSVKNSEGIPKELIYSKGSEYLYEKVQKELVDDKRFAGYFTKSVLHFSNIVEDSYLERTLLARYNVIFAKSLILVREYMWRTDIPTVKCLQEKVDAEEITSLKALFALFLTYGKYGKVKRDSDLELKLDIIKDFKKFSSEYLKLIKENRKTERFKKTIYFVLEHLYDLIKEEYENVKEKEDEGNETPDSTGGSTKKSGDSESGEGESKPVPGETKSPRGASPFDDIDVDSDSDSSMESDTAEGEKRKKTTFDDEFEEAENPGLESGEGGRIDNSVEGIAEGKESSGLESEDDTDTEDIKKSESAMDDFIKRIEALAKEEEKKSAAASTEKESVLSDDKISGAISDSSGAHNGIKSVIREGTPDKNSYDKIYNTVSKYISDISKRLKSLFDTLDKNYTKRGLWYGGRLDFRTAHRPDIGFYQRDVVSDPKADLALFILIDESGSMSYGNRIPAATRATVLLDAVATNINIPCAVYGHTETSRVELLKYRDFDDKEDKKYLFPNISARSNNRDGFALKFALEKLKARKEEKKLLIIISDGQPAACCYGGQSAIRDMQSIISSYKDIQVLAAAIGGDKDVIHDIYGSKRFLDCSDLSVMGEKLVKVLQKASLK